MLFLSKKSLQDPRTNKTKVMKFLQTLPCQESSTQFPVVLPFVTAPADEPVAVASVEGPALTLDKGVAELLQTDRRRLLWNLENLAESLKTSRRTLLRYLHAVAECTLKNESLLLAQAVDYARLLHCAGFVRPMLFLHNVHYDETQMVVRAGYGPGSVPTFHKARVFVITQEWCMLLARQSQTANDFICLKGARTPILKPAQNATAETVAKLLEGTCALPGPLDFFDHRWRVIETDEGSNNLKAEQVMDIHPRLHIVCAGHKTHDVCSRTWELFPELRATLVQTIKVLKSPGALQRFSDMLLRKIEEPGFLVIRQGPLDESARSYRDFVLAAFAPKPRESRVASAWVATIAHTLLNGDWRKPGLVEHVCGGNSCCPNGRPETIAKLRVALPKLLAKLRLQRFELDNWKHWHRQLYFVGFLGLVHRVFMTVFADAFAEGRIPDDGPPEPPAAWRLLEPQNRPVAAEVPEVQAGELARMLRVSLRWWTRSTSHIQLFLVGVARQPQVKIMEALLQHATGQREIHGCVDSPGPAVSKS